MRKTTVAMAGALFLAAALALTGCPNSATVQPEGGKAPSATTKTKTEKIEAVSTTGTMGKPETKADGSATLTTTDDTGGRYTFTQPAAAAASSRSAGSSTGGTWDYTNSRGIKQFAGSYTGDITSSGANSLSLSVEKAADASGNLQATTSPQSFEFKVTDTGSFTATIPAVEIVVQQPEATAKLIKTVTQESSYSNSESTGSEEKRFRFEHEQGTDGNIIFYIPTGTGSDGEFLSSAAAATYRTPKDYLIAFTYLGLNHMTSAANDNHTYQFTGLLQNMQDVVDFLESRMNLTIEGKDLFEQIKRQ